MKLHRDLKQFDTACVATIGNFDGVHLGHQAIFEQLREAANKFNLPILVITFDPQPREFFQSDCPARLTRLREKLYYFKQFGIENVVCLRFNKALTNLSAEAFVKEVLLHQLKLKHLVVGDDFRFGHQRQGDYALLKTLSEQNDFTVTEAVTILKDQSRVSSTRIRTALQAGDLAQAKILLGHSYVMQGRITHGDKIGRTLGFPTANIQVQRKKVALQGVFAVKVHGLDRIYCGAANLGTRPAVGGTKIILEVHLFDFDQTVYGKLVEVEFCHRLRDEVHYTNLDALKVQIAQDVLQAKQFFE